jgi:hypothetical protein
MFATSLSLLFGLSACVDDWGQSDPPAGTDKYPKLEKVATFDFEEDIDPQQIQLAAYSDGNVPELVDDETLGSKVLHLNGGYAKFFNPFGSYELQEAASMTFLVKQQSEGSLIVDEEGNPVLDEEGNEQRESFSKDLSSALVSFQNANGTQNLYITPNGGLVYDGIDGELTVNDASSVKTGMLEDLGEWHYVALSVTNDGYQIYVDGNKRVDQTVTDFDCSKLVQFISDASYAYVGYGADDHCNDLWVDDVTFYRNNLTSSEIADPRKPAEGEEEGSSSKWIVVGSEDNTDGFWSSWSDYVNLTGDGTIHYEFYNYGGPNNWNYWGLVITNGLERDESGYKEWLFLRCDNYGWASNYDQTTLENDYNFDTYATEMDGAFISMDITRSGETVTTYSVITCTNGNVYHYKSVTTGITGETIGTFFTCDGSHYEFDKTATFVGTTYEQGTNVYGATDYSTGWWSVHTPLNRFDDSFEKWGVEFINGNSGGASNWNNWLLVCTNGTWIGDDGYSEYFVLRSDAYGWGSAYDSGTMTQSFNWDTYVKDMHNADCKVIFNYQGGNLLMKAFQTTEAGVEMPDYLFEVPVAAPIGLFFTMELAYVDILRVGYWPWIDMD